MSGKCHLDFYWKVISQLTPHVHNLIFKATVYIFLNAFKLWLVLNTYRDPKHKAVLGAATSEWFLHLS